MTQGHPHTKPAMRCDGIHSDIASESRSQNMLPCFALEVKLRRPDRQDSVSGLCSEVLVRADEGQANSPIFPNSDT